MSGSANKGNQLAGAYCGYAIIIILMIGWWGIAGFVPPPSPADGPDLIAERFRQHNTEIRIGLLLSLFGAALLMPWYSTLAVQVRRIEGRYAAFANVQLVAGAAVTVEFILPLWLWATAAFRPNASAEIIQRLNDAAWLPFLGAVSTTVVQCIALGIVVLQDKRARPVFPRWFGYFNFWAAIAFVPGGLILFFHNGPLAWNGIIAFWMVFTSFGVWTLGVTYLLAKAVREQDNTAAPAESASAALTARVDELTRQMSALSRQLTELRIQDSQVSPLGPPTHTSGGE